MYCMPETTKKPARLNALTAWRFIAAMLIVLEHARHDYLCLDEWLPERFVFGPLIAAVIILHPEPKRLTEDQANAFISTEENGLARDMKVGDGLELEALVLKSQRNLAVFDFVWRSTREQSLRYYLYAQLLDHQGTKFFEQPCNFAPRAVTAKEGEQFLESLTIPQERLEQAKQIGIMVVKDDKDIMRFSGGTTDMGQLRLLLPADAVMDKLRGRRISTGQ